MQELEHLETPDGLFLERLEAFMQKCLLEVKAFSEREHRSYEETMRRVAEWHTNYLFERGHRELLSDDQHIRVRPVLLEISHTLESLHRLTGAHSFFLAVNPGDSNEEGFLGGTTVGREFWRGLRGGGDSGAKAFKAHCLRSQSAEQPHTIRTTDPQASVSSTGSKSTPAVAVKNELYNLIRDSLRSASGKRNAEMKWTNHERLSAYGVHLVGWPDDIPKKNPSTLNVSQNKQLLKLAKAGTLRFVHNGAQSILPTQSDVLERGEQSSEEDVNILEAAMDEFVWADRDYTSPSIPSTSFRQNTWSGHPPADGTPFSTAENEGVCDLSSRKRARYGE